jgi:hypothetical protein
MSPIDSFVIVLKNTYSRGLSPPSILLADPECTHEECIKILEIFNEKNWDELRFSDIQYREDLIPFLSTEAFRYFLPAFILFILDDEDGSELLQDAVLQRLTPPKGTGDRVNKWINNNFDIYSQREKIVIKKFLELVKDQYHIWSSQEALQRIWQKVSNNETGSGNNEPGSE